ncbi:MAG TPA: polyketide synthase dehydratase domain-containing protein, partial [Desulfosarcina sp.]|nr:polyketide synthase dehydratase domain-containing protein [Desulfosarcina sp.]
MPIAVVPPPFFRDHHVQRRPVFPAVEAMERLSDDIRARFPDCDIRRLSELRFDKFLYLDDAAPVTAVNRVTDNGDGSLRTALATRFTAPGARISRCLEHAAMTLGRPVPPPAPPPLERAATLAGVCTAVDPERIYTQLVPFGPAYRNISADLLISGDGALARVGSPRPMDPRTDLALGSPYVLDAAFHAACVWCQRYRGCVAFPVFMAQRTILRPTRLDGTYTARVMPVKTDEPPFVFDIFIYDDRGRLCESAGGVAMRDVSGGRNRPPEGFFQPRTADSLEALAARV